MTSAMRAAVEVGRQFGVRAQDPIVLQETNHTLVWLRPEPIVAKVGTGSSASEPLRLQHAVCTELAAASASVVAPLEDATPVAHAASGFLVTLWHRFEGSRGVQLAPEELAESLRSLHAELARTKSELPSFRVAIDNDRTALDEDSFMAALDLDSRTFLRDVYDEGLARLDEIETKEQRLHGEPYAGNRLLGPEGLR